MNKTVDVINGIELEKIPICNQWDFEDADYRESVYSLHPYPAKFIPEIPRKVINIFGIQSGTALLDPFCGSGTALLEAQAAGIPSVGVDINPIACLISKVATQKIPAAFLNSGKKSIDVAQNCKQKKEIPNIPNVNHWFESSVQEAIGELLYGINSINSAKSKDALKLVLSSILVKVSNQDSDTRYAAVKKQISKKYVYEEFLEKCKRFAKIMNTRAIGLRGKKAVPSVIINADLLKLQPSDIKLPVGLIVTSPPYPNAYEYWLYHKYRMWWLGYDPLKVKEDEIGARAHFFKKNHHTANNFRDQMNKAFYLFSKVVVDRGIVCVVIGRSIIHGKEIDNASIVINAAKNYQFKLIDKIERNIAQNRKSFNLRYGNIKKEEVVVLKKV